MIFQPYQRLRDMADFFTFSVSIRVKDIDAATAANYGLFFIAPFACTLVKARERHAIKGTDGSPVTLDVEKLVDGKAKGAGVSMLSSTFNLKGTNDTVQAINPTNTLLNKSLVAGNGVGLLTSGTLTALKDVCVTLTFKVELKNMPT